MCFSDRFHPFSPLIRVKYMKIRNTCIIKGFDFDEFYRSCYFEIFNSVLIKNLEMNSSFFRIFILVFSKISKLKI
jgi:hypothetical protein